MKKNRTCVSCGGPVSKTSASGRCRACCYGEGSYMAGSRWSAPTESDGIDNAPYFNAIESNRAMVRALRRYAQTYHPDAAWLRAA